MVPFLSYFFVLDNKIRFPYSHIDQKKVYCQKNLAGAGEKGKYLSRSFNEDNNKRLGKKRLGASIVVPLPFLREGKGMIQ